MRNQYATAELRIIETMETPEASGLQELLKSWGMPMNAQESFWVVAYDGSRNMRSVVEVARGSYNDVVVSIPSILSAVLLAGTDRFMVVHNHPSGDVEPSAPDITLTQKIAKAANACGLTFEDHVIIGPPDKWYSMMANGIMVMGDNVTADRAARIRVPRTLSAPMLVACGS